MTHNSEEKKKKILKLNSASHGLCKDMSYHNLSGNTDTGSEALMSLGQLKPSGLGEKMESLYDYLKQNANMMLGPRVGKSNYL